MLFSAVAWMDFPTRGRLLRLWSSLLFRRTVLRRNADYGVTVEFYPGYFFLSSVALFMMFPFSATVEAAANAGREGVRVLAAHVRGSKSSRLDY